MTRQERRSEARMMAKRIFHRQVEAVHYESLWKALKAGYSIWRLRRTVLVSKVPWFQFVKGQRPRPIAP